jgi:hypothetical protein
MPSGLTSPPRDVPWSLALVEVFGEFMTQFGLLFLGFGLIFVQIFVPHSDLAGWHEYSGSLETAQARVGNCVSTHFNVGGSKSRRGTPVIANPFTFTTPSGAPAAGASYGTGDCRAGQSVLVEWPAGRPERARIRGMSFKPLPPTIAFTLIFPLIGALFLLGGVRVGLKDVRLLREGKLASATVAAKRATKMKINNRLVWEFDLAFKDDSGIARAAKTRTYKTELLEDGAVPLLYLPSDPTAVAPLATMPGTVAVDSFGALRPAPLGRAAAVMILPIAVLAGHGGWLLLTLMR